MTVVAQDPFNEYTGNGVATAYGFEFEVKVASHLVVKVDGAVVSTGDYSVSGVGVQAGGTVTFDTAPADGAEILIYREVPLARSVAYTTNGPFPATTVNLDFDLIWMVLQQLGADYAGVLRVPYPNTIDEIPGADDRGDRLLGFHSTTKQPVVSQVTMTQLASTVAAAYTGASGPLDALSFIAAGTGARSRTAQDKARDIVSWKDFGAQGDTRLLSDVYDTLAEAQEDYPHATALSQTVDWAALQAALDSGAAVYVPDDTFQVDSSITLPTRARLYGAGVDRATINSDIVGDSLFKAESAGASFLHVSHMRLNGNNIVGAGGSGHCFNMIDPAPLSGSATPQISRLENLWIDGFLGTDSSEESGSKKIASAGVIQYGTLGVTCERVYVSDCGHGFYFRRTQNCRLVDSLATDIQKAAVFAYDNENLVVDKCDLIDCGKSGGTTDSGYPDGGATTDLAGVFVAVGNNNMVLSNSKLKGFQGKALIVLKSDGIIADGQNIVIENNWIRGDAQADQPHKAIYAERIAGLMIRNNTFTPSNTGYSASQKYQTVELYMPSTVPAFESTIEGNVFQDVSGFPIEYNIKIGGNGATRSHRTTIRGNRFGSNSARSAASVVDTDILLSNCLLDSSAVGPNTHTAPSNVTRTVCVTASSLVLQKCNVGPSLFQASSGTITANYSGITESVLTGSATYNPASLAASAAQKTTLTVTGAEVGDYVTSVSHESDGAAGADDIEWRGKVTAANTVTVWMRNNGAGAFDMGSGTLRARVTKTWAA